MAKAKANGKIASPLWTPQPRQAVFMSRWEYEALYGGAAGGGKSEALVIDPLRQVHIPHFKALILRKTYPQLGELIEKSLKYYKKAWPGAKFNGSEHFWRFPSGAKVQFGSMHHLTDRYNYQGLAYDVIDWDELEHFTWDEYSYMFSRNRPNGPGTIVYMRGSANPGGIGHMWIKNRFIDAGPPNKTIWEPIPDVDEQGNLVTKWESRIFIPAKLSDNPALNLNDPNYRRRMHMLPEKERKALMDGNWDIFAGQYFPEWVNHPTYLGLDGREHPTKLNTHVIAPLDRIPGHWKLYQVLDWGYGKPFSIHWYAVDEDGRIYAFKEFYGCNGTPNVGIRMDVGALGHEIKRMEFEDERIKGKRIVRRLADREVFKEDGGESMRAVFDRLQLFFERADDSRITGWQQVHRRLTFDENGMPMLYVTQDCPNLIRTLPSIIHSETKPEDIADGLEDHAVDDLRYMCMESPLKAIIPPREIVRPGAFDPLNQSKRIY